MRHDLRHRLLGLALVALALTGAWRLAPGAAAGRGFATLEEAATALVNALRSGDTKAILGVLGPEGGGLVSSGDRVADRRIREAFVAAYDERHRFEAGGGRVTLVVGKEDFPLPIPLVPEGIEWRFDTVAGKEEILNRRIGQNELNTIQVCLAIVDAQREYYVRDPDRDGVLQYAQRFASTPGRHNGLYWPTRPGEPPSPLGDLVARARSEGYRKQNDAPVPYWGYYYRILNSQGKDAPGGAYSYLAHGRMMGGFAVVAYPAEYGASGVMTFLVNHDGVVYQKDLGPGTATLARKMAAFNPDATWKKS